MTKPLIDQLVDRLLSCPLPKTMKADPCACNPNHPHRTGTNLLTASEAKQVLQHIAGDLVDAIERLETECAAHEKVLRRIASDASGTERIRNIAKDALGQ